MNKILVICGPTSTGKTSLALHVSQYINSEIISADSRQVYMGMDIGTGKDIPKGSKIDPLGFYEISGTKVWGYDLANPKEQYSVSHYMDFAKKKINRISKLKKTPIIVGGTGLYIKAAVDGIDTASIPRNDKLRAALEPKSAEDLYESLSLIDTLKAASLNSSDKKNPRRLIRAIEIAQYNLSKKNTSQHSVSNYETLFVGLTAPKEYLEEKIKERVTKRVVYGLKDEIKKLLKNGVAWEDQSMKAIGYGSWRDYFENKQDEQSIISAWTLDEIRYAKRQMVWFKKDPRINWFDVSKPNYVENVDLLVKKWYI